MSCLSMTRPQQTGGAGVVGRGALRGLGPALRGALMAVVATGTVALFAAFALVLRPPPAVAATPVFELPRVVITAHRIAPPAGAAADSCPLPHAAGAVCPVPEIMFAEEY